MLKTYFIFNNLFDLIFINLDDVLLKLLFFLFMKFFCKINSFKFISTSFLAPYLPGKYLSLKRVNSNIHGLISFLLSI